MNRFEEAGADRVMISLDTEPEAETMARLESIAEAVLR